MANNGSDQPNDENAQPAKNDQAPGAAAAGDAPPKTEKQLAKEKEKADKLKKLDEKNKARVLAEEQVFTDRTP